MYLTFFIHNDIFKKFVEPENWRWRISLKDEKLHSWNKF